jgi:DnaD/phage-associated family protein
MNHNIQETNENKKPDAVNFKAILQNTSILSQGYGSVARCVMRDKTLSVGAKCVYSYLVTFAGSEGICYPSRDLMMEELGLAKNTFTKYLKELRESGYIVIHKNRKSNGKMYNNVYEIILDFRDIKPCRKNEDVEPCRKKRDTVNCDSNNNSIKYINNNKKILKFFETYIGIITPNQVMHLLSYIDDGMEYEVLERAIEESVANNKRSYRYVDRILNSWINQGFKTLKEVNEYLLSYEKKKPSRKEEDKKNTSIPTETLQELEEFLKDNDIQL